MFLDTRHLLCNAMCMLVERNKAGAKERTPHNCCPSTSRTNTPSLHGIRSNTLEPIEAMVRTRRNVCMLAVDIHGCILQHIWYNKEANHAAANIHLIELGYTSIASSDGDISECNIQIIFSYNTRYADVSAQSSTRHAFYTHLLRAFHGRVAQS